MQVLLYQVVKGVAYPRRRRSRHGNHIQSFIRLVIASIFAFVLPGLRDYFKNGGPLITLPIGPFLELGFRPCQLQNGPLLQGHYNAIVIHSFDVARQWVELTPLLFSQCIAYLLSTMIRNLPHHHAQCLQRWPVCGRADGSHRSEQLGLFRVPARHVPLLAGS